MPNFEEPKTLLEEYGLYYDERTYDFIMLYLLANNIENNYQLPYKYYSFQQKKIYINKKINDNVPQQGITEFIKKLNNFISLELVGGKNLLEIKKDSLKTIYFYKKINTVILHESKISLINPILHQNKEILIENFINSLENQIDLYSMLTTKDTSISVLNRLENNFKKDITKIRNFFSLINKNDKEQNLWINSYLTSKHYSKLFFNFSFEIKENSTKENIRDLTLINFLFYLESISLSVQPLDIDLHIEKTIKEFKNAYAQYKFRDTKKTIKEFHLPLTKQAKSKLQKISSLKNLSEYELLETLINECYEQNKKYFH